MLTLSKSVSLQIVLGLFLAFATSKWNVTSDPNLWPNVTYVFPAAILAGAFFAIVLGSKRQNEKKATQRGMTVAFVSFALSALISMSLSPLPYRALTVLPFLVLIPLTFQYFRIALDSKSAYRALAWCSLIHALAQLLHLAGILPILGPLEIGTASGLTWYYLQATQIASLGVLLWLIPIQDMKSNVPDLIICAIGSSVCLVDVWVTGSRIYTVAATVAVLIVVGQRVSRFILPLTVVSGVFLLIINTVQLKLTSLARLSDFFTSGLDTLGEIRRSSIQNLAWNLSLEHPFGIGWGGFVLFSQGFYFEKISSTHNLFSSIVLDFGLVALCSILYIFSVSSFKLLRLKPESFGAALLILLIILVAGLVDTVYIYPPIFLFQAAIIGAVHNQIESLGSHNEFS